METKPHERMIGHLKAATAALERHITATGEGVATHIEQVANATTELSKKDGV